MRKNLTGFAVLLGMVGCMQVSGCLSLIPPQTFPFNLGSSGTFNVEAGVAKENVLTVTDFDTAGFALGNGSLKINPDAISVTPGGSAGKGLVNLQSNSFTIEVRIAAAGEESTVCAEGELYGPYTVELDENYNVVSITPSSVTFSSNTVALLNAGSFVLCVTVEADFNGQVRISQFEFTVQLA